jgi:hypothetical protein
VALYPVHCPGHELTPRVVYLLLAAALLDSDSTTLSDRGRAPSVLFAPHGPAGSTHARPGHVPRGTHHVAPRCMSHARVAAR